MTEESAFFFYSFYNSSWPTFSESVLPHFDKENSHTPISQTEQQFPLWKYHIPDSSFLAAFGAVCTTETVHFHPKGYHSASEKGVQFCIRTGTGMSD